MAIKVGGTTVVDDSRGLTNIATVDATTAAAISAAGVGGGGEHDFVASGAIASGDVVVLNSDGTVSVVTSTAQSVGSSTVYSNSSGSYSDITSTFDTTNNKVVIVFSDTNNLDYGTAVVGTVSGTSISFGTPVVFNSADTEDMSVVYDTANQKVVITYMDVGNSRYGTAIVGTVSGTSISFGTPVVFYSGGSCYFQTSVFDSSNNKIVVFYRAGASPNYMASIVGTVSGTSISFGSAVTPVSTRTDEILSVFDTNSNKVVVLYQDYLDSNKGKAIVGTVSGTSISFGSPVVFANYTMDFPQNSAITFDSINNKVFAVYRDWTNSFEGMAIVGTVSGTSISFGTPVVFNSGNTQFVSCAFDSNTGKVVTYYRPLDNYGYYKIGTISGNSVVFDTAFLASTDNIINSSSIFDSNSNKIVTSFYNNTTSAGSSFVYQNASTTASSYIGIAAEDISDTATGKITIDGGVNEGQSSLAVVTTYYVADNGDLQTTNNGRKIGKAISASELLVDSAMTGDETNEYLGSLV